MAHFIGSDDEDGRRSGAGGRGALQVRLKEIISNLEEPKIAVTSINQTRVVRFEVFMAVTMTNGMFWDVTPCGACKNRRFGGMYPFHHQGDKNWRARSSFSALKHATVAIYC
jgi:hypothetical protein